MAAGVWLKARARKRTSFLFLWLLVFCLVACQADPAAYEKLAGKTMGTSYHVTLVGEVEDAASLQAEIDALLVQVNKEMSTYDPESTLMQLNRAPLGEAFALPAGLQYVLAESGRLHEATGGAFDVTVGPLVNRWGFGPEAEQALPSAEEIAALQARVGFGYLSFSESGGTVTRERDVFVDLSAIAKGYGVDRVAELLQGKGFDNFLVEIGGELRLAGVNPYGKPWRIAVERPELAPGSVQAAIGVSDMAMATSGNYRNFRWIDGKQYAHTISPVTGWPVEHQMLSVTVLAENCTLADGLATAFSVMGPADTLAYAQKHGLAVFLLEQQGDKIVERWSKAFEPYLED
ncbi:FAD:protein FMN transferase [Simiduia sp. 21SJ11W-1]|uniref:FAD:protein FMN transferase n=1 Tax=Simiduia sp. 21SJ11W-1 TaxID=2909669 RepID=UPI00209D6AAE|nr:FAD:protein FMN transferase [Simiduia sp. 21SJ11W-1]UTA49403.1 FAD:protein FMN transferase [Simiduia sp. 21SJ11W-1]